MSGESEDVLAGPPEDDVVHLMTIDGCKISINGQGHLPCSEHELPKVWVEIELDAGIEEDWADCGLEAPPESAEQLLELIKSESRNSIHEFIRDWDLLTHVTVNIQVRKPDPDRPGRWINTLASWSES